MKIIPAGKTNRECLVTTTKKVVQTARRAMGYSIDTTALTTSAERKALPKAKDFNYSLEKPKMKVDGLGCTSSYSPGENCPGSWDYAIGA